MNRQPVSGWGLTSQSTYYRSFWRQYQPVVQKLSLLIQPLGWYE